METGSRPGVLTCKEITELATEYAEDALDAAERRNFESHLAGCPGCQAWVDQLQLAVRAVGRLPSPEVPAELEGELMRRFADWRLQRAASAPAALGPPPAGNPTRRAWLVLPAMLGAAALLVGFARGPSRAAADWLTGLGLAAAAVVLAAAARRLTASFAVAAVSAALVAALLRGAAGPVSALAGLDCLLTEALMGAGTLAVAWLVARRGPAVLERSGLGILAVAGALAGDAALQVTCAHHASLPHLLLFHVGGVAAIAAAGWLTLRPGTQAA